MRNGIVPAVVFHAPNMIASTASLTSAQAETIFPTTQGKVHIDFIQVSTGATEIPINAPVVVNLQHPSGSPVYMTIVCNEFKSVPTIPGFLLPAGGLQATSNRTTPVSLNVFYENG